MFSTVHSMFFSGFKLQLDSCALAGDHLTGGQNPPPLVGIDGKPCMIKPQPGADRDAVAAELGVRVREDRIFGVVHVAESWMYIPKSRSDHTLKQIMTGEIAVSELKPKDRTEALVVMAESRDRWEVLWFSPIRRDGDKVSLAPTVEFEETPVGRFAGLFGE